HPLYLLMHFLGEVHGVNARQASAGTGEPTELAALLECEGGLGTLHVSLATVPWELGLTIRGTTGTIRVDLARQRAILARPRGGPRPIAAARLGASIAFQTAAGVLDRVHGKLSGRLRGYPGMRALVQRFYAAVRDGLPPPVPYTDGAAVAAVL